MKRPIVGMIVFAIVFASIVLSGAYGYHVGFKAGLDTKITFVGDQYVMKLKKGGSQK